MEAHVKSSEKIVEFWSSRRLPFQPRDDMLAGRNSLRRELRKLPANCYLRATYSETKTSNINFDVENVLIYNVGPGSFPSVRGIEFAYEESKPATPGYCQRYEIVEPFQEYDEIIAETSFCLPKISSIKPHEIWWAISEWHQNAAMTGSSYGLRVSIFGPDRMKNLVAVVKPMFDGIISSLQHLTQLPHQQVIRVLSEELRASPDQIIEKLTVSDSILGGNSKLVRPYGTRVSWNPDDHLCRFGSLRQSDGDIWRVHAKLIRPPISV